LQQHTNVLKAHLSFKATWFIIWLLGHSIEMHSSIFKQK
jgi:hypothetical protein